MLIIGQPDMLRDLRNSKWSRQLSATLIKILVSGENHNLSNLVFSLCMSDCLAKVQDTAMSLFYCSPRQHFLMRPSQPVGLSCHIVMQPSGSQYIPKSCTLSPLPLKHHSKIKTALFHAVTIQTGTCSKCSSRRRTIAFWGNLSPLQ